MGVYIPNMAMPKDGTYSIVHIYSDGHISMPFWGKGMQIVRGITAVPIPEGHGRLIDADALVSKYTEEINKLEEWAKIHEKEGRLEMFRACHLRSAYLAEAKLNIEAAHTIAPAEGGKIE